MKERFKEGIAGEVTRAKDTPPDEHRSGLRQPEDRKVEDFDTLYRELKTWPLTDKIYGEWEL